MHNNYLTCEVKHRFETEAKPTNFHRIFDFYTVTEHPDSFPVLFGERGIVVRVECWALQEIIYKMIYETPCLQRKPHGADFKT